MGVIGNEIVKLEEVDSTNRFFMDWLTREKPAEGTLVITEFQTAGKGNDGTSWESERGLNLTFSFVLYPDFLAAGAQFYLNKTISLGLADAVKALLPGNNDIRIKWPNDIYVGTHKVAGTLIQNGVKGSLFDFSVIGIGLNVNQTTFYSDAINPVSLKIAADENFDLEEVLEKTVDCIEKRYEELKMGHLPSLDQDYLKLLYRFQQLSDYTYKGNRICAKITGVNRYGHLVLEIPGEKIIECDLKEVKFEI